MTKKNLVLFLIFCVVLLASIVFRSVPKNKTATIKETLHSLSNPSDITFSAEECELEDKITFKYYQDYATTSEQKQENIGYINNKFGLYVYSTTNFLKKADQLVNSNGGDWGYVLIPYNVKDYDSGKWKEIFETLSTKHLIPVIQLWDVDLDDYEEQTEKAAKFLNKFPWPIEKKYISAYNEMNDARFWKDKLDPEGYAEILDFTIKTFKQYDSNFFIMNGAFNATAPNIKGYMAQEDYMLRMEKSVPGIFGKLDGWASHPYPQPAFLGKPWETGRASIRAYEWELEILKSYFGVEGLPVFITETGWPHAEGENYDYSFYDAHTVSQYIKQAFEDVWLKDPRVVAVMPFTIYYDPPFDHFSWVKKEGSVYPQFDVIKALPKVAGRPPVLSYIEKEVIYCK